MELAQLASLSRVFGPLDPQARLAAEDASPERCIRRLRTKPDGQHRLLKRRTRDAVDIAVVDQNIHRVARELQRDAVSRFHVAHTGIELRHLVLDASHIGGIIPEGGRPATAQFAGRTIAHELHDSLAQSLASLSYQVRVLDETLHQGDESTTWQQLERIENSLDESNTELRELIANFRAPVSQQGLIGAIQKKKVTYDLARQMDGAEEVSCSAFGEFVTTCM